MTKMVYVLMSRSVLDSELDHRVLLRAFGHCLEEIVAGEFPRAP